jgi:predicted polyphosphate/ATP-dependent NAD kinase
MTVGKSSVTVGIIANPSSGRDIRRLISHASVFPTAEKASMVQRVLAALGALGVPRAVMMPDLTGICATVSRAQRRLHASPGLAWPEFEVLAMPNEESVRDTLEAVARMVERGVSVIVVLGGDGTHRAVAAKCGTIPLATLSTGTNNVFPDLREATVTGLAAGLVALGRVPSEVALRRNKLIRVASSGGLPDEIAVVDVCVSNLAHIGAKALWQPETLSELVVAFAEPDAIGLSSIAGLLRPVSRDADHGLYLRLAPPRSAALLATLVAPIGPGLVAEIGVAAMEDLPPERPMPLRTSTGTIAFDGERELEISAGDRLVATLSAEGPYTIDVPRTLSWVAANGVLNTAGQSAHADVTLRWRMLADATAAADPSTKEEMR